MLDAIEVRAMLYVSIAWSFLISINSKFVTKYGLSFGGSKIIRTFAPSNHKSGADAAGYQSGVFCATTHRNQNITTPCRVSGQRPGDSALMILTARSVVFICQIHKSNGSVFNHFSPRSAGRHHLLLVADEERDVHVPLCYGCGRAVHPWGSYHRQRSCSSGACVRRHSCSLGCGRWPVSRRRRRRERVLAMPAAEREELLRWVDELSAWIVAVAPLGSERQAWTHLSTLSIIRGHLTT